jgi:phosphoribosylglycinamide formyltransferase-1
LSEPADRASTVVLISGGGTNLQSIIDASGRGEIILRIAAVISNEPPAKGLERARKAKIPVECIENGNFPDRQSFDQALIEIIDQYSPDLLILAGFMRILTPEFVTHYDGRILNIHPSLLPAYTGLHTHQRAIDNKEKWHGCTVHFVTEQLDGGPPIIQGRVPVLANDTADTLAARVLEVEHKIYPIAADLLASGRIRCKDGVAFLDDKRLERPIGYPEGIESL